MVKVAETRIERNLADEAKASSSDARGTVIPTRKVSELFRATKSVS